MKLLHDPWDTAEFTASDRTVRLSRNSPQGYMDLAVEVVEIDVTEHAAYIVHPAEAAAFVLHGVALLWPDKVEAVRRILGEAP